MTWRNKPNEDVQVGDVTYWLNPDVRQRIIEIEPYSGPLADIILAVAYFDVGLPRSLEIGGMTEVLVVWSDRSCPF
jgi:hypothetical protein